MGFWGSLYLIVFLSSLLGLDKLQAYCVNEWITDILKKQLPSILGGVGPMHSFVQIGIYLKLYHFSREFLQFVIFLWYVDMICDCEYSIYRINTYDLFSKKSTVLKIKCRVWIHLCTCTCKLCSSVTSMRAALTFN